MKPSPFQVMFRFQAALCLVVLVSAAGSANAQIFDQKLSLPLKSAVATTESPFEKQFRKDTGATLETLRTVVTQPIPLGKIHSKAQMTFKFDLSAWPEIVRAQARLWVAIGAPAKISTSGMLNLTFTQNGCGVSTALNNDYNVDGLMILGNDCLLKDGEATLEVENGTHLNDIVCTLFAVVYVPAKP